MPITRNALICATVLGVLCSPAANATTILPVTFTGTFDPNTDLAQGPMFGHSPASLAGIVQVVFDLDLAALTPAAGNGDPSQTYSEFSEPTTWLLSIGVGGFILSGDGSMRLGNPNDFGGRDYFETSVVYSPGSNGFADMKLLGKTANDLYSDWHDPSTLEFINMPAELQLSDNQGLSYWVMPGVITIRAIPEPSTWILLSLGFGLIGGALRRRRTYVPA